MYRLQTMQELWDFNQILRFRRSPLLQLSQPAFRLNGPMGNNRISMLQTLIERYADACVQDELAGVRDLSRATLKRTNAAVKLAWTEIERTITALEASGAEACVQVTADTTRTLEQDREELAAQIAALTSDLAIARGTEAQAVQRCVHLTDLLHAYFEAWDSLGPLDRTTSLRFENLRESVATVPTAQRPLSQDLAMLRRLREGADEIASGTRPGIGEALRTKADPCGNEDCDKCDPRPRWKISQHRLQHITYTRKIKAADVEKVRQLFETGTAWPSQYDDTYGTVVQLDEPVLELLPPDEYHLTECCYHDLPSDPKLSSRGTE
jgi:hypothetical protein